jgi:large subunit ribosomal protein L6
MVEGVEKGFTKTLEFEGIGYRAEVSGKDLALSVGFTHPVKIPISEGLTVEVQKNTIVVSGYDKEAVGQFAAVVRSIRPPEPYKGTGIRYQGEVIRRKAGKKLAGSGK